MLVAKPEWMCSRLVTLAASHPPFVTGTRSDRLIRSSPAPAVMDATTRPSWISSRRSMTGCAADAAARTSTDPPAHGGHRKRLGHHAQHGEAGRAKRQEDDDEPGDERRSQAAQRAHTQVMGQRGNEASGAGDGGRDARAGEDLDRIALGAID